MRHHPPAARPAGERSPDLTDEGFVVSTHVGQGLFEFGHRDGAADQAFCSTFALHTSISAVDLGMIGWMCDPATCTRGDEVDVDRDH